MLLVYVHVCVIIVYAPHLLTSALPALGPDPLSSHAAWEGGGAATPRVGPVHRQPGCRGLVAGGAVGVLLRPVSLSESDREVTGRVNDVHRTAVIGTRLVGASC